MCTIFSIAKGNKVFFGNTEDNIRKEDETFIAFIPSQNIPARWTYPDRNDIITNYGFMLLGVRQGDKLFPQGGMNEHGLAYDINFLPSVQFNGVKGKPWNCGFNYFDLLMNTKNIDEVINHFRAYTQSPHQWGAGQIHFSDATGKSVVVGINEEGDLGFSFKEDKDYLISTNFSINNRKEKIGYPCKRYDKANEKLEILSKQKQISTEDCTRILEAVKIQYGKLEPKHGTVYGNVFELVQKTIHLYHLDDFINARVFQLNSELARVQKDNRKTEFTLMDNAIEERFNFENLEVHIIDSLFS